MERHQLLIDALAKLARRRDDQLAWARLYESTRPVIRMNLCVLREVPNLVEDATQDVFIRLYRYCVFRRFDNKDAFLAYLRVVCRNVSKSYVIQSRRRSETPLCEVTEEQIEPLGQQFESRFTMELAKQQIRTMIVKRLVKSDRLMLEQWLGGCTLPQIASDAGVTYANAAVRIHRLLQKIIRNGINELATLDIAGRERAVKKDHSTGFLHT